LSRATRYDSRVHKAIRSEFEGIWFDSQWELSIYQNLRMLFPKESIYCHVAVTVLPPNECFPALNWKVDFMVSDSSLKTPLYIEAKGVVNQEIKLVLQALSHTNPNILKRLLVVTPRSGIKLGRKLVTCNLNLMLEYISHLKN
jgi:hypothetical protein